MNIDPPGAARTGAAQDASVLGTLPPGTPVAVLLDGREEVLFLLGVRRTRFIAEAPDGRTLSIPSELFVRVHEGPAPARIPPEEAETRALIRALGSRYPVGPALDLAGRGAAVLPLLLDELARAFDRIEDVRGGSPRGPLGSATGSMPRTSSRDLALARAIPLVVCSIARATGAASARAIAERHPDARVRRAVLPHVAGRGA
ncbi:MAG: hypothetical protein L0323_07060 [Planctomycetes bacterium]|nr:hypothetical protein [Planctomycetota bacterium]